MDHPIVDKILKEGIRSVNLSMLDEKSRKSILTDVGEKLYRQGKLIEAIDILEKAGDIERLKKLGDLFASEGKFELAALCFIPTKDKDRLNNIAVRCIELKNYKLAAAAYDATGNKPMADFMRQNFG
ncbi:hypothetical protein HY637_01565 [Candidatus Woesearchaeota archaeon]|nr:hypothetical protein [Candidatus Woesearchaeota archaeon]